MNPAEEIQKLVQGIAALEAWRVLELVAGRLGQSVSVDEKAYNAADCFAPAWK